MQVFPTKPPSPEMSGRRFTADLAAAGLAQLRRPFDEPAAALEVSLHLLSQHVVHHPMHMWQNMPLIYPSV